MKRNAKIKKPTEYHTRVLRMIAQSRLIKTRLSSQDVPRWSVDGICEISHECAQALIRNGWVVPQRDGLPMFEETQTYVVLKP